MEKSFLEFAQMLNEHPILNEKSPYKITYINFLEYFVYKYSKNDLWANAVLRLYVSKLLDDGVECNCSDLQQSSAVLQTKFFTYRYCLLFDCIFINAYNDRKKGEQIMLELAAISHRQFEKEFCQVFNFLYDTNVNIDDCAEIQYMKNCWKQNRKFIATEPTKVMITANMSAGKSTLLNALVGKKVNKTQNDACTAKIHYIVNKPFEDNLCYELDGALELDADYQTLMEDNTDNQSNEIVVGTHFRTIGSTPKRLWFIDTPGVNFSQDKRHKEIAENAIRSVKTNILIYLINGEHIGTNDDTKHLQFIHDNYDGKILFVVNKVDSFYKNEESIAEALEDVAADLKGLGFENPQVVPISAYAAFLAKMSIFGETLNEDEQDNLEQMSRKLRQTEYQLDRYYPEEVRQAVQIDNDNDNYQLLLHSGILQLENIIYNSEDENMREIQIKYNPYRLETTVLIDGAAPKPNSKLNFGERRLQEWIEELPKFLYEECSTSNFNLTFHGTNLDYEDVEAMAREAKKANINIELTHIPAKEVADKETAISEIFDEIQNGPFAELKQPDVINAFELAKSSDFEVSVVATMSAGKSTLINALLGQKLMPSKNEACTATITEIKDTDDNQFTAVAYNTKDEPIQTCLNLTLKDMRKLNDNPQVSKIRVKGNIPFVTSEDVKLVLIDTPGPNNARNPEHKATTCKMLSKSSKAVVLYIFNGTQLHTNDDDDLLSYVADSMKVGGKQSRDRFIFVLNKLDEFNQDEDSVEGTIEKVRNYLEDSGIENPNIYPVSAKTALDIRTILAESDDDDDDNVYDAKVEVRKFNRNPEKHLETKAPLTPSAKREIEKQLAEARDNHDKNKEALIHCGIIPIEMAIQMYVRKYAKTAKIKNIVDTFSKRLESAKTFEKTKQEIVENQDKKEQILAQIEVIEQKINSGEEAKYFKEQIDKINYDKEIKKETDALITEVQEIITKHLSPYETKITKCAAESVCSKLEGVADNIQRKVEMELEELIEEHVYKNANDVWNKYKEKIFKLAQEVSTDDINIDPFKLMEGDISIDTDILINKLVKTEKIKSGKKKWAKNPNGKWYIPWRLLRREDIYIDVELVDGKELAEKFFAPVEERMFENCNHAVEYAKEQSEKVKEKFKEKFDELDAVLMEKMQELKDCTNDKQDVERRIQESQDKLEWLQNIQAKLQAILDI